VGFVVSSFAALNVAFTIVWIWLATVLAREYKEQSHKLGIGTSRAAA
jgi:hypothetical protein